MSNYQAIAKVSQQLKALLQNSPAANELALASPQAITFQSPVDVAQNSDSRLSLWLYHINKNRFVKNQPIRKPGNNVMTAPPLTIELHYLLTPLANSELDNEKGLRRCEVREATA